MRFLAWLIIGLWLASAPAFADDMTLLGVGGRSGAAPYVGPLDVYGTSPLLCYSLRACAASDATGTTNAVDVHCNSTTFTGIKILTSALVDVATIKSDCPTSYASFTGTTVGNVLTTSGVSGNIAIGQNIIGPGITDPTVTISSGSGSSWVLSAAVSTNETGQNFGTSSITVPTWYDQVGGHNATAGTSPLIFFGGCQGSLNVCVTGSTLVVLSTTTVPTTGSPLYFSTIYNRVFSAVGQPFDLDGNNTGFSFSANTVSLASGGSISATANDLLWHSINGYVNNADSKLIVDGGTPVTGNTSVNHSTGTVKLLNGGRENGPVSVMAEIIVWASEPTTIQMNGVCHNQFAFWETSTSC